MTDDLIKCFSSISDLMIKLKIVKKKKIEKRITHLILFPTSINLTAIINNQIPSKDDKDFKYQSFILYLHEINLNMSPLVLNASLKMFNSINVSLNKVIISLKLFFHLLKK